MLETHAMRPRAEEVEARKTVDAISDPQRTLPVISSIGIGWNGVRVRMPDR